MATKTALTIAIATVWFINGLYCKLLLFVPRHQMIVARILGDEHATLITRLIGFLELMMVIWIISRIKPRLCALVQIVTVAAMNIMECFFVPDLLLFGYLNALLAAIFILVIYTNEFILPTTSNKPQQAFK